MNQEQLHDALTELPEELIASTAQARTKKKVVWGPWVALAACACLAVVLGVQILPMFWAGNAGEENAGGFDSPDSIADVAGKNYGYSEENSVTQASVLLATVVEIREESILVAPLEGEALGSDSRIVLAVEDGSGYAVGDTVRIRYDGQLLETWPLQLGLVYSIERLDAK